MKSRNAIFLPLLVALAMVSCAAPAKNTEQAIYYAYGAVASVRSTAANLVTRGRLNEEEKATVQKTADAVRCGLDTARYVLGAGPAPVCDALAQLAPYLKIARAPPQTAEDWLFLANDVLLDLERQLKAKGGGS